MAYIIIGVVLGIIIAITDSLLELYEKIIFGFLYSLVGVFIGFLLWLTFGAFVGIVLPKTETTETKTIYALNDCSNISSTFYLTSCHIDEEEVIKYISDAEYGKKIFTANVENSYINEGYEDAYVEIHHVDFEYHWMWWFAICLEEDVNVFYVPNGSVTNEIEIDLE